VDLVCFIDFDGTDGGEVRPRARKTINTP
jgi:hypothetical protein